MNKIALWLRLCVEKKYAVFNPLAPFHSDKANTRTADTHFKPTTVLHGSNNLGMDLI